MSNDIVFSWLGPADVSRAEGRKGPVAEALLQLKPDKAVLLYPAASFKPGSDAAVDYQNFLESELDKTVVKVLPVEYRDESYEDAYTQANEVLEAERSQRQDARFTALITGGMMQQGLIWVFLAKKYRLKLVNFPKGELTQQIVAPIDPNLFKSSLEPLKNCRVFAWVAQPEKSTLHHQHGAVLAWLEKYQHITNAMHLLVDVETNDEKEGLTKAINGDDNALENFSIQRKSKLQEKSSIVRLVQNKLGGKLSAPSIIVGGKGLSDIYYDAMGLIEGGLRTKADQAEQTEQIVFLVNGGNKENNLAWILLKILYPEARLIAAWKNGKIEELSPDQLENPHPVAWMLWRTSHWFDASAQFRALPHDSTQMEDAHWQEVYRIWPWLNLFGGDPNLFTTLKSSCGAFSAAGNGKNSPCLGTVLLLVGMALNEWCDFPARLKTGLGSTWPLSLKMRLPAIESVGADDKARCYERLLCAFHDFFKAALWDQNDAKLSTLQEIKVEDKQLCLRLNYGISAIGSEGGTASPYCQLKTELQNWKNISVELQSDAIVIRHGEKNG